MILLGAVDNNEIFFKILVRVNMKIVTNLDRNQKVKSLTFASLVAEGLKLYSIIINITDLSKIFDILSFHFTLFVRI